MKTVVVWLRSLANFVSDLSFLRVFSVSCGFVLTNEQGLQISKVVPLVHCALADCSFAACLRRAFVPPELAPPECICANYIIKLFLLKPFQVLQIFQWPLSSRIFRDLENLVLRIILVLYLLKIRTESASKAVL